MAGQPNISDEQRANLAKLAAYLRTLPADYPDFAMAEFTNDGDGWGCDVAHLAECGTAACAAGHGPVAGVAIIDGETWNDYSRRAFVEDGKAWGWCFSACWAEIDNTAHGAAARIEWLLAHGVPDDADAQYDGEAPLCYTTTPKANS